MRRAQCDTRTQRQETVQPTTSADAANCHVDAAAVPLDLESLCSRLVLGGPVAVRTRGASSRQPTAASRLARTWSRHEAHTRLQRTSPETNGVAHECAHRARARESSRCPSRTEASLTLLARSSSREPRACKPMQCDRCVLRVHQAHCAFHLQRHPRALPLALQRTRVADAVSSTAHLDRSKQSQSQQARLMLTIQRASDLAPKSLSSMMRAVDETFLRRGQSSGRRRHHSRRLRADTDDDDQRSLARLQR